ncbi:HNH endonuclease [Streptomyces sp. NPDC005393]|uniref:HNH endonuclease n=1 Tax=Streptomyces sp. NPDC005393 TaxID=3157041 RepID=UPI0033A5BA5D
MDSESACWFWTGGCNPESIRLRPSLLPSVHRVVFKLLLGGIPEGFQVSHAEPRPCHHTRCCNPNRLEAVIKEESVARSD